MTETDHLQQLVRGLAEAIYNDPGEKPVPMATTDAEAVIKAQLTENTGTHFLDSGGAYGRHWEENQNNPPWERPVWSVGHGYVTQNVYHFMERTFDRDELCVALEGALYALGHTGDRKREAWLRTMESFAERPDDAAYDLRDKLPDEWFDAVLSFAAETARERDKPTFSVNTYNQEFHGLSQCLQGVNFGGPYAEYAMIQVHQGADVRGGYTGPRVYKTWDAWLPTELFFRCDCGWEDAESVIYGSDDLLYQTSVDPFELVDEGWLDEGDEEHPALAAAYDADHIDGAVFHRCGDEPGEFGHVAFM